MQRIDQIRNHLQPNHTASVPNKSDDDVVICCALRTALTKSRRGGLKDTPTERLLAELMKATFKKTGLDPKNIGDITFGNVLQPGAGFMVSRMAQFLAGVPYDTPLHTVNRLCSSGLEACAQIVGKIKMGLIDVGLAGGFENMSQFEMESLMPPTDNLDEEVFEVENARNCMMGMGQTAENVAEKFKVTRQECDTMGVDSQNKALNAQKTGLYKEEIVPIKTTVRIEKDGQVTKKEIVVDQDDGCRATTAEGLAKLKPSFKKDGICTAGNSSQTTDGAAVVLLAKRSAAKKLGLPILGRWITYAVAGVPVDLMGIGPAVAIPKALSQCGLKVSDIDIFELNEAFASQAVYCAKKLDIPMKKINPKGGAIALGHPLGCTGSRLVATLMPEMKRTGAKYGIISMCIGSGMGAAAVIEREQN